MEIQLAHPDDKNVAERVHIGSLISQEMRQRQITVAWLARQLSFDPSSVYKILHKATIDTGLLCRISMALGHDFFEDLQAACGFGRQN